MEDNEVGEMLRRLVFAQERQADTLDVLTDYMKLIVDAIATHAEVFEAANDDAPSTTE